MEPNFLQEYAKEQNKAAWEHNSSLLGRAGIATGALALCGNMVVKVADSYQPLHYQHSHLWLYIPAGTAVVCAAISALFLLKFFVLGGRFAHMPSPATIAEWAGKKKADGIPDDQINIHLQDKLTERYATCAHHNNRVVQERKRTIFWSIRFLVFALLLTGAAMPGYLHLKHQFQIAPIEVQIVPNKPAKSP